MSSIDATHQNLRTAAAVAPIRVRGGKTDGIAQLTLQNVLATGSRISGRIDRRTDVWTRSPGTLSKTTYPDTSLSIGSPNFRHQFQPLHSIAIAFARVSVFATAIKVHHIFTSHWSLSHQSVAVALSPTSRSLSSLTHDPMFNTALDRPREAMETCEYR